MYSDQSQPNLDYAENQLRELSDVIEMYVGYELKIKKISQILFDPFGDAEGLTPLLRESAKLIALGKTPQEQANELVITVDAAKQRAKRAAKILGVSQREIASILLRQIADVLMDRSERKIKNDE